MQSAVDRIYKAFSLQHGMTPRQREIVREEITILVEAMLDRAARRRDAEKSSVFGEAQSVHLADR